MSSWLRFHRSLRQSRIRLPRSSLRGEEIAPGDRVQIGTRVFRVERACPGPDRMTFRLVSLSEEETAELAAPTGSNEGWRLTHAGSTTVVPGELLVVFPVV